jgi:NTP pyrophosphatase (non-canonical NTP hydrolase)
MNFTEYQSKASKTAHYPSTTPLSTGLIYCALKLAGEAGEYAQKIGKIIRDDDGQISITTRETLILELGDILWYISQSATELGVPLNTIAWENLSKLASRSQRNTIQGSGDSR